MTEFYDLIVNKFLSATTEYLDSLDWHYMIALIVVMELLKWAFPKSVLSIWKFKLNISNSLRTLIVALLLCVLFYWFNDGGGKPVIKQYFQSALASMVLYTLALGKISAFITERFPVAGAIKDKMNVQGKKKSKP